MNKMDIPARKRQRSSASGSAQVGVGSCKLRAETSRRDKAQKDGANLAIFRVRAFILVLLIVCFGYLLSFGFSSFTVWL